MTDKTDLNPNHLTLGQLIDRLKRCDPDQEVPLGFYGPHSYRGDYHDLAFEPKHDTTVAAMLHEAEYADGATFMGYKGGDYVMDRDSFVWLANHGCCGESLGAVLLELMLTNSEVSR
jgi:hypothetical protein